MIYHIKHVEISIFCIGKSVISLIISCHNKCNSSTVRLIYNKCRYAVWSVYFFKNMLRWCLYFQHSLHMCIWCWETDMTIWICFVHEYEYVYWNFNIYILHRKPGYMKIIHRWISWFFDFFYYEFFDLLTMYVYYCYIRCYCLVYVILCILHWFELFSCVYIHCKVVYPFIYDTHRWPHGCHKILVRFFIFSIFLYFHILT